MTHPDTFVTKSTLTIENQAYTYFSLPKLAEKQDLELSHLPVSIKILLENMLRNEDGRQVQAMHIEEL
ncbi:MAG: hypothetical protein R2861_13660, partial [Desulfobacterales bacterium]